MAAKADLSDWLALNGLTAALCQQRLDRHPRAAIRVVPDPAFADPELVDMILMALRRGLPQAGPTLDRIASSVRIDLSPDPVRFPRAFTLHDDGRGEPFISCPLKGRLSDVLMLAHEVGHACHILANPAPKLPPVLRETVAYLAEELVIAGLPTPMSDPLRDLHRTRTARIFARSGAALAEALNAPGTSYAYGWNYPVARDLATRAQVHLTADEKWQVFSGQQDMAQLLQLGAA